MSETPTDRREEAEIDPVRILFWLLPAIIVVATAVAFYPCLDNEFVWDDEAAIVRNEHLRRLDWENLRWMFSTTETGPYQPLAWVTLAIDRRIWGGETAWGHHFTNVVIHIATAVAFYFLTIQLLRWAWGERGRPSPRKAEGILSLPQGIGPGFVWAAATGMALFALHPLRVESVAWAVERRDVLSGLFFLLTGLAYLRYAGLAAGAPGRKAYFVLTLFLYVLALLSKATTVTLPVVLVLLDIYPLRRLRARPREWWTSQTELILIEKIPFFVLAMAAGLVALLGQSDAGAMKDIVDHGVGPRLVVAAAGVGFYLVKTVAPIGLSPLYELTPDLVGTLRDWICILVGFGTLAVAFALRRRFRGPLIAWCCYFVMLLPTLGLIQVGVQRAADRYSYLPSLSIGVLVAGVVLYLWRKGEAEEAGEAVLRAPAVIVIALVAVLSPLTWRQCDFWENEVALWWRVVDVEKYSSAVGFFNLATALQRQGPLGGDKARHLEGVIQAYRTAVRLRPDFLQALQNLGNTLTMAGRHDEAIQTYQKVLEQDPLRPDILANMTLAAMGKGDFEQALAYAKKATEIDPNHAPAQNVLGLVLAHEGKIDEAIEAYQRAIAADPKHVHAIENLFGILMAQARYGEAVDLLRDAMRNIPDDFELANNLAYILATCPRDDVRNGPEAVEIALRVCRHSEYKEVKHLDTLAAAYARVGEFEKAVQTLQQAIDLISAVNPEHAARLSARQQKYANGQPLTRVAY